MIPLAKFLECVRANAGRITGYQLGRDGSDGKCDCIGLIIGALRLGGEKWTQTHGSNYAARYAMGTLEFIPETDDLFLGEIVYKARSQKDAGYSLPDGYRNSSDQTDYYHVGVVTSLRPLIITHCTGNGAAGGIRRDGVIGNWRWGGKLKYVDYASFDGGENTEGVETMGKTYEATVHSDNGKPVNLRSGPGKHYPLIDQLPAGSGVTVVGAVADDPKWLAVQYKGRIGYMMSMYLAPVDVDGDTEPDEPENGPDIDTAEPEEQPGPVEMVSIPRETLETWIDVLEEMARDMREALKDK